MLIDSLYHPPLVTVEDSKTNESNLYLVHDFEGKQLVKEFIPDTLMGLEFLWGGSVQLETTEIHRKKADADGEKPSLEYVKVLYTMQNKKIAKKNL